MIGRSGEIRTPDPLLPKKRVEGNSLYHQCALVRVGFVSFVLSSPRPALHLPSASDVPTEETCTDRAPHKNLIDGLVRANSFPWVRVRPQGTHRGVEVVAGARDRVCYNSGRKACGRTSSSSEVEDRHQFAA